MSIFPEGKSSQDYAPHASYISSTLFYVAVIISITLKWRRDENSGAGGRRGKDCMQMSDYICRLFSSFKTLALITSCAGKPEVTPKGVVVLSST
jgi:hypothetical protein